MTFTGHVQGGVVVFDGPAPPDGAAVRVEVTANGTASPPAVALPPRMQHLIDQSAAEGPGGQPPAERWPNFLQHAVDLPADAASQVDHYLYGTPKR
jgi:hypothetical protein